MTLKGLHSPCHTSMAMKLECESDNCFTVISSCNTSLIPSRILHARDDVTVYSVVTRGNKPIFSSYVNCIVLATVYAAAEGITQDNYDEMKSMRLYGDNYLWSLKDAVSANGNYDEIYAINFSGNQTETRGRNALNAEQNPQLFDIPGL